MQQFQLYGTLIANLCQLYIWLHAVVQLKKKTQKSGIYTCVMKPCGIQYYIRLTLQHAVMHEPRPRLCISAYSFIDLFMV